MNIRREDGALGAALGNILVLERLSRCKPVVLVEQLPLVDRVRPIKFPVRYGQ